MMVRLNSLRLKVLLAYVAGTVLSILLLVIVAILALQTTLLARMDFADSARDMSAKLRFDERGKPVGLEIDEDDFAWVFDSLQRETSYRVLDETGAVVLLSSADTQLWSSSEAAQQLQQLQRGQFELTYAGTTLYGATEPIVHNGKKWYFQVVASARLMTLLHRVAMPLVVIAVILFGLVLLLAFGVCAYLTLRFTLKPLNEVSDSAVAISPRSLHARLKTESLPTEIAPLVESFNRALERLERGYRVQQEFLSNAAHELKTPLALIRAQIELGASGVHDRDALLSDVEYMTRQVQQLLLLAEASEVQNYDFSKISMQSVAKEAVAYLQRMAESADVHLAVTGVTEDVVWKADRGALFTLLKNLLENALQHAPARSAVEIDIQPHALTVRDRGSGVDAAQLPLLFERFWRASHRRDLGAGLGLAICQEIALSHGWRLSAEQAEPGLRFHLSNEQIT